MKKFQIKHKKSLSKANLVIIAIALVAIAFLSVGYAYLSQQLNIGGSITKLAYAEIHFDSIGDMTSTGNGYSYYNPTKTANSITTHVDLPALNSSVTYTVTLKNDSSVTKQLDAILVSSNSNNDIVYSLDGIALQDTFIAGSTTTFTITLSYKNDLTTLPENTVQSLLLTFDFVEYVPIQMAYASGNMILKLDGLDTPVNDNWYDEDNNKTMTLTNVPHNNVQHYYDFSGSGFGTMGTALIPETGDFTLEALVALPLTFKTDYDMAIVAQVDDVVNDPGRFKLNLKYEKTDYLLRVFLNDTYQTTSKKTVHNYYTFLTNPSPSGIYNIQLVRKGNKMNYYLNGELRGSETYNETAKISQGPFKIGYWNETGVQSFTGSVFAVRLYGRALEEAELTNNINVDNYNYFGYVPANTIRAYAVINHLVTQGDGLYANLGGSYSYKGNTPNNYLKFDGDSDYYRIISFEEDGSLKVMNETAKFNAPFDKSGTRNLTNSPYCTNSELQANQTPPTTDFHGCNSWSIQNNLIGAATGNVGVNSSALTDLQNYYTNTLSSVVVPHVLEYEFFVGLSGNASTPSAILSQIDDYTWTGYVGIPSIYDIVNATAGSCTLATNSSSCNNYLTHYTDADSGMWSINGAKAATHDVWAVVNNSSIGKRRASRWSQYVSDSHSYVFYLFPTFYIEDDYSFTGTGTREDPFIIY